MVETVVEIERTYNPGVLSGYLLNGVYSVPLDPSNTEYQEIQEWIAEGGVPTTLSIGVFWGECFKSS